jgi:hypothetical protein
MASLYEKYYSTNKYYGMEERKAKPPPVNRLWNVYGASRPRAFFFSFFKGKSAFIHFYF